MKIIDARSGMEMKIGDVARYDDGEYIRLIDVDEGLFSATAVIEFGHRDVVALSSKRAVIQRQVPLTVRFFHPSFFMQKVGFINT